ncbi:hypothetical protein D3C84_1216900 [compost metagenome]
MTVGIGKEEDFFHFFRGKGSELQRYKGFFVEAHCSASFVSFSFIIKIKNPIAFANRIS